MSKMLMSLRFIRLIAFAFMNNNNILYVSSLISPMNQWNSNNNHNILLLINDHSRSSTSHHNNNRQRRYHQLDSSNNDDNGMNNNEIEKIKLNDNAQLGDNNNVIMINGETDMKKVRRFNYKVNALMGTFDPNETTNDTEYNHGNILNAIINFPTKYTFHVVAKIPNHDEVLISQFTSDLERILNTINNISREVTDNNNDNNNIDNDNNNMYSISIKPRGTKFTKFTIDTYVYDANMISSIYQQLSIMELSIMQF